MKSNPAVPGGSLESKPTWPNTFGCSATSAFFVLAVRRRACQVQNRSPRTKRCSDERQKTARTRTAPRHSVVANRRGIGLAREPGPPLRRTWPAQAAQAGRPGLGGRCGPSAAIGSASRGVIREIQNHQHERTAMRIDCVNAASKQPAVPAGERMLTVDELARQFRVSTKTVCRWRRLGLVSRRFLLDGRRRVGFLQSSVDRFLAHNGERVRRSTPFSRMTDEERERIIDRARCLAQAGGCRAKVASRIAQETGRSVETIRNTLKCFDPEHPDTAIFPHSHHPLRDRDEDGDLPAISPWRVGGGVGPAVLPDPNPYPPHHQRHGCRTDHGAAAGPHRQRAVRPPAFGEEGARDLGAAAGRRSADEEAAGAQRSARVSGQPVRGAPADAGAGGASFSEDELPQVQGEHAACETRSEPARRAG